MGAAFNIFTMLAHTNELKTERPVLMQPPATAYIHLPRRVHDLARPCCEVAACSRMQLVGETSACPRGSTHHGPRIPLGTHTVAFYNDFATVPSTSTACARDLQCTTATTTWRQRLRTAAWHAAGLPLGVWQAPHCPYLSSRHVIARHGLHVGCVHFVERPS